MKHKIPMLSPKISMPLLDLIDLYSKHMRKKKKIKHKKELLQSKVPHSEFKVVNALLCWESMEQESPQHLIVSPGMILLQVVRYSSMVLM